MHTIYMGVHCLLKADPITGAGGANNEYVDREYDTTVTDTSSLASLFGSAEYEALLAVEALPLNIYCGRSRELRIFSEIADEGTKFIVEDEMGSHVDFHDITLGNLFMDPEFVEL